MKLKFRQRRGLMTLALLGMLLSMGSGCVAVVHYEPNLSLVELMGPRQAQEDIAEVLRRAVTPRIGPVLVTDEFIHYNWERSHHYRPETKIFFANLKTMVLYENNFVFLHDHADRILAKILFATPGDAKQFIDLVSSFQHVRMGG